MSNNRETWLFVLFSLAIIFSIQLPLPFIASKYASVNSSDFAILLIFGTLVWEHRHRRLRDWDLRLSQPRVLAWFLVAGAWIVVTLAVAIVRTETSMLPNILWALKWFEIAAFFVLAQQYANRVDWNLVVWTVLGSGLVQVLIAIGLTPFLTGYNRIGPASVLSTYGQPTVFWQNPNALSVFFALIAILAVLTGGCSLASRPRPAVGFLAGGTLASVGVVLTGSRSGLIALLSGLVVASLLSYRHLSKRLVAGVGGTGLLVGLGSASVWNSVILERFLPTVSFEGGSIVLTGKGTGAIYSRYDLTLRAVDLWRQQPIFGYGWFASPETVGYLDVFYAQMLVDVGIVGVVIFVGFYLALFRAFVSNRVRGSVVLSAASAGWVVGLLCAGIGGAYARVPRLMFLFTLLLVASAHSDWPHMRKTQ